MAVAASTEHLLIVLFLGLLAWAALSDSLHFRVPNTACLGIVLLYPSHVLASAMPVNWLGGLITAAVLFIAGAALFSRGFIGGGDVKLLAAAGLWAGPHYIPILLVVMGVTGALLALPLWFAQYANRFKAAGIRGALRTPLKVDEREVLPYGIAIAAGASVVGVHMLLTMPL
ncbi:MAG TPA: prepilin peptidase [Alphaproteobacteria bacterium]|nr:prepilin peptidase [Alphaproteobacteria bacterium]